MGVSQDTTTDKITVVKEQTVDQVVATLAAPAVAGDTTLRTARSGEDLKAAGFYEGCGALLNPGGQNEERVAVAGFGSLILEEPLKFAHFGGSGPPLPRQAVFGLQSHLRGPNHVIAVSLCVQGRRSCCWTKAAMWK